MRGPVTIAVTGPFASGKSTLVRLLGERPNTETASADEMVQIGRDFDDVLERVGEVPLPPYNTHEAVDEDASRYQTVYARVPGAVAAPTAGNFSGAAGHGPLVPDPADVLT